MPPTIASQQKLLRKFSLFHGVFNIATGLWPLLHRRSFEAVMGEKTDYWLAQSTGLLISVSGLVTVIASTRGEPSEEIRTLGMGTAASLAAIDLIYTSKGRIPRIYALDCVLQSSLAIAWAVIPHPEWFGGQRSQPQHAGSYEPGDPVAG